ncbi:MAG: TIGR00266 family protein, partial [Ketobacter sp.]
MKTEIKGGVAFSYLDVELEPGESITTESDAMSSMDADIELRSRFNGGFFIGLLRKFLGGETLFINDFTNSTQGPRRMTVVQPTPGQVRQVDLNNETLYMQPGAFLACSGDVKVGVAFAGFISWIAREGLFRIAVSGSGTVWY